MIVYFVCFSSQFIDTFNINSNEARQNFFSSLQKLREAELFVDLTIRLNGGSAVVVHKCVVAAASRLTINLSNLQSNLYFVFYLCMSLPTDSHFLGS